MHSSPDLPPPTAQARSRWLQLREWVLSSRLAFSLLVVSAMLLLLWWWRPLILLPGTQPLVMQGGDPYLRALMRTISASESNVLRPYNVMYGSTFVWTLDNHPNRCQSINQGPNKGNCSTAAGRYQLLNSTWTGLATRYHPERVPGAKDSGKLSFAPIFQDQVVYQWLADNKVWRVDLSAQLRQGKTRAVLRRLSGTWTSLGYGIESNSMSADLPDIYKRVLADELERAAPENKN
ncbi:MAG: glycoside hydrolase family protein [Hydrogenophaga sp.]